MSGSDDDIEPGNIDDTKKRKSSKGKLKCDICKKKCTGDILRSGDKYYHIDCFVCKGCRRPLNDIGFFIHDGDCYCAEDYHAKFGTKCPVCNQFVEGDVIQCMGKTFHQQCFRCDRCRQPFPSAQKVTFTGREHLCQKCTSIPVAKVKPTTQATSGVIGSDEDEPRPLSPPVVSSPTACASCNQLIHSGQVLLALDAQWHIWCFKCTTCSSVLHGEYMAKDGLPYCIRDYNAQFGVMCYECGQFIAGKVLQAGEYYFHPQCAGCSRCGGHFEEREEMYMQGDEIWHSRCNDIKPPEKILHSVTKSPKGSRQHKYSGDFGKHLTYMYLLPEQNVYYLKQPIGPHPPQTPQFHMPQGNLVKIRKSRISMFKTGLQKLAEILDEQQPRPKSPHMDNEEPIELSHYPGAHVPEPDAIPAIERDDFPAPPYPYAVEELRRRLSQSDVEDEDEVDKAVDETYMHKAEEELKKYENESSIAKVVIQNLEERTKKVKAPLHWDPRSASRTPSAKKLPHFRCRYESPINASPSRYLNRPRPWEFWEKNRSATVTMPFISVPKPGYGLAQKSATLPVNGYYDGDVNEMDITQSTNFSEGKTYIATIPSSYSQYDKYETTFAPNALRSSLPDMTKPPKIYTYPQLITSNKKLPEDVDRCHLERHLNKDEFERLFEMTPLEFYKLPDWKRINMKRRAKLY